jgi:hypothetical protein
MFNFLSMVFDVKCIHTQLSIDHIVKNIVKNILNNIIENIAHFCSNDSLVICIAYLITSVTMDK